MSSGASAKSALSLQILYRDLYDVDLPCRELVDEICPREAGDLCGPALGDHAAPVPFYDDRKAHVLLRLLVRWIESGEDSFRQLDGQGCHGLPLGTFSPDSPHVSDEQGGAASPRVQVEPEQSGRSPAPFPGDT